MPRTTHTEVHMSASPSKGAGGSARESARGKLEKAQRYVRELLRKEQQEELEVMKRGHQEAMDQLVMRQKKVLAEITATEASEAGSKCGTCEAECQEEFFVCAVCQRRHSNTHKGSMTTCVTCSKTYCAECLSSLDKCAGCAITPQLDCCNLQKMPCGEYEGGSVCAYYHHKHCRCEQSLVPK
ncbi:hypothetical protein KIPB_012261 [Kipferlia bialata]|uniref:Uncharacterized protein n=1 Tax=Kipferlia bialata TaxID=797122 RepID=A0A9K3GNS5_9EUKA|nr:hypothetical protein KIPB_012261 [Kipferlia bialata]|eukprot:g12261.t1